MAISLSNFHAWILPSTSSSSSPAESSSSATSNPNPNSNFTVSSAVAALDVEPYNRETHRHRLYNTNNSNSNNSSKHSRRRPQRGRRRNHSLDLDFDMVLVPSDYYISGSDSEGSGSDWSIGWFEPHAPEFCSDGEAESSFAVLVPCYGSSSPDSFNGGDVSFGVDTESPNPSFDANSKSQLWAAVLSNIAKNPRTETNHYLQQWLSSLQT